MNRLFYPISMAILGLFALAQCGAADEQTSKTAKDPIYYSKIAEAGPGVYMPKFDKAGRIESVLVVGTSRISTVLGATKGKQVARQSASIQADAEFTKWLKQKVSVHETRADETVLFMEGSEENDKEALREAGKAVEKTGAKYETRAKGLLRGMQIKHVEQNGKEKTLTVVKVWRAKTANAVKDVEKDLKTPAGKEGSKEGSKKGADEGSKKKIDKKIEDKKTTIDD